MIDLIITNGDKISVANHEFSLPNGQVDWLSGDIAISGTTIYTLSLDPDSLGIADSYDVGVRALCAVNIGTGVLYAHDGMIYHVDSETRDIHPVVKYDLYSYQPMKSMIAIHGETITLIEGDTATSFSVRQIGDMRDSDMMTPISLLDNYDAKHGVMMNTHKLFAWRGNHIVVMQVWPNGKVQVDEFEIYDSVTQLITYNDYSVVNALAIDVRGNVRLINTYGNVTIDSVLRNADLFMQGMSNGGSRINDYVVLVDGAVVEVLGRGNFNRTTSRIEDADSLHRYAYYATNARAKMSGRMFKKAVR